MPRADNLVMLAEIKQRGFIANEFILIQAYIGTDNHYIAGRGEPSSRAVHRDDAGTFLGANSVCCESLAVIDVIDVDLFVLSDPRALK